MPSAMLGSVSDKQFGWMLSKSLPVLRISLNRQACVLRDARSYPA